MISFSLLGQLGVFRRHHLSKNFGGFFFIKWLGVYIAVGSPTRPGHGSPDPNNPTQPARKKPDPTRPELRGAGGRGPYFLTRNNQRAGHGPWFLTQNPTQPEKPDPKAKKPDPTRKKPDPTRPRRVHGPTRPDPVIGTGRARAVLCDPWPDLDPTRTRPDPTFAQV